MNYSKITDQLYIGTAPKSDDYAELHELGISLVINMVIVSPPKRDPHKPPLRSLWLPTIDSPLFPLPMAALQKGVIEALQVIKHGGIVYAHCKRGRHRGPAMGACVLIGQGMDPDEAMDLIKEQRPVSDLHIWYIRRRIDKFAQIWSQRA
jgi:protein tyrosine phosphatase (PTP) superfamily phosphohydrolase (DUF442 family)